LMCREKRHCLPPLCVALEGSRGTCTACGTPNSVLMLEWHYSKLTATMAAKGLAWYWKLIVKKANSSIVKQRWT
jgi:hypothetical protein